MDILIKNMEMPKSCEKCPLKCVVKSNPMIITNKGVSRLTKEKDCPLIPVPGHGDLIDRDKLISKIETHCSRCGADCIECQIYRVQDFAKDSEVVLEANT